MVKPLSFKGDKKTKKRKRADKDVESRNELATSSAAAELASTEGADDQNWVSADVPNDIAGPVVIILPSTPLTCLASDANGKIFASEVENMVEGDPSTAEPHDVRQVWVATKIAGTEGFNFKGHHGRYGVLHSYSAAQKESLTISCDCTGILVATSMGSSAPQRPPYLPLNPSLSFPLLTRAACCRFKYAEGIKRPFFLLRKAAKGTWRSGAMPRMFRLRLPSASACRHASSQS